MNVTKVAKTNTAISEAQDDWVTTRVDAASKISPVSDAVTTEIKKQLNSNMREHALRPAELTDLAKNLLEAVNKLPVEKGEVQ